MTFNVSADCFTTILERKKKIHYDSTKGSANFMDVEHSTFYGCGTLHFSAVYL